MIRLFDGKVADVGEREEEDHIVANKPFSFKGNGFILLVKPRVVEDETRNSLYRLKKKEMEGNLPNLWSSLRI